MSNSTAKSGGIGFCGAMFLLFLGLRLTDHIDWAWYWVAAPLWMTPGIVVGVLVSAGVIFGLAWALSRPFDALARWRRNRRRERARRERDAWRKEVGRG